MSDTDRAPRFAWAVGGVVILSVVYLVLELTVVRPYLWPAGHGVTLTGDSRSAGGSIQQPTLLARPPDLADHPIGATIVRDVRPNSPVARAGVRPGDEIVAVRNLRTGARVDLGSRAMADPADQIRFWRTAYWNGLRGPLEVQWVRQAEGGAREMTAQVDRAPVWRSDSDTRSLWAVRHLGPIAQMVVFIGCAAVLFAVRASDGTAALAVLALTLSAVGGAGPLMGGEGALPPAIRELLTIFAWIAAPFAFPTIALAVLYFPRKAELLVRYPRLHLVPFAAAAPMIVTGAFTGLFLAGADNALRAAVWDARHPSLYYASFAAALAVNVLVVMEGIRRYQHNPDANERRRIRVCVYTAVPGVLAYTVKDGLPTVSMLTTQMPVAYPWWVTGLLQIVILLPAFGVAYAVAVHRVLGPRMVLRRSLQYALAKGTLTLLAILPAAALTLALVRERSRPLGDIFSGAPAFYFALIALSLSALKYRDRARTWLDQRFFRQEYDAQKILVSLASRVRFETDPGDLAALVVEQIDQALHPQMIAILVSGIENDRLVPVAVAHGSAESLPAAGGLVTMLRWSDEPLEISLSDPRSPARRLPPEEREWLECTTAALLVPVISEDRALVAMIALGNRRSEEPYTGEDRGLLASIAAQMGLGFDVARLRRRVTDSAAVTGAGASRADALAVPALAKCPHCGRCEEATVAACPDDGAPMATVLFVPHVVDHKYRIDRVLGEGGMGAVYRAHDLRLERDVALKVVRTDLLDDPEARKRFRREAQIVARLQHPSIVSIFDYGTFEEGGAYLVMELVKGEDLRQALTRDRRFTPGRTVRLMLAICSAIEGAHREGILHRDLKPENILLPGGDVEVKILDFGVAKLVASAEASDVTRTGSMLTMEGTVVGTPAYMAPEQLRGQATDGRTDVFSLGVIAYEMVSGELPFGRGSTADIALRQVGGPPPLARFGIGVGPAFEQALRSALAVEPAGRPSSPMAFARQLQQTI